MLISYSHRFIFFHVAKTGGLSVKQALGEYAQEPETFKIRRPPKTLNGKPNPLYAMWESYLLHATARETVKALPPEVFNTFYKFAFVRNPWDWQVSMYHFILAEKSHVHRERVQAMRGFDEYVEWVVTVDKPYPKVAVKLQKHMLTGSDGELVVDFVGRYETFNEDFHQICQRLGLRAVLPHLNKTNHRAFQSYYNEKTRRIVEEHFREDIELFGYTFDGYVPCPGRVGQISTRYFQR